MIKEFAQMQLDMKQDNFTKDLRLLLIQLEDFVQTI